MNRGSSLSRGSGAHDSDTSDIAWKREGEGEREQEKFRLQSDFLNPGTLNMHHSKGHLFKGYNFLRPIGELLGREGETCSSWMSLEVMGTEAPVLRDTSTLWTH